MPGRPKLRCKYWCVIEALADLLSQAAMRPCASSRALKARQRGRPVHIVPGILLAGPDQLHRRALALQRDGDRLRHHVHFQPAAKTAAEQQHLDG